MAAKKVAALPMMIRRDMVRPPGGRNEPSLRQQCVLADISRSGWYAARAQSEVPKQDVTCMNAIDKIYTAHPEYGSRRISVILGLEHGLKANRKRVQRLMRIMEIAGCMPGPNTSKPAPENKVYPYLLRGVRIDRPNQVWSTDITYIPMGRSFVYLTAVIDWYSRFVISWELSNSLDSSFCIEAVNRALHLGKPEIFNTDQGAQYTSDSFLGIFEDTGISISMDGRGRALDNVFVERLWRNVKYEKIYLQEHCTVPELYRGLSEYFGHYNHTRPHQSLNYETPSQVYNGSSGGGPLRPRPYGPPLRGRSERTTPGCEHQTNQSRHAHPGGQQGSRSRSEVSLPAIAGGQRPGLNQGEKRDQKATP